MTSAPSRFAGRRVVVTGAAGGLGSCVARMFADEGASVLRTDVVEGEGIVAADLTSADDLERLAATALAELGGVDVLCNVAGAQRFTTADELTIEGVRRHLDVNAVGPIMLTHALIPALVEARGNVVSVASISALMGQPYNAPYCASKAALLLGMRALATELAGRGVRVNCVSPGGIETAMTERAARELPKDVDWNLIAKSQSLIPGFMPPKDVAESILFLASDAAVSITGANLVVDRGVIW
ncbi:MAG: SDR family NAD(P)-dependent oxidoreductase [Jatrophihabitans sp.]|uniref:SDR family NAD(P)-dependent oxidoreductase n=1 Tax=Jatrophihabitans sp. TaxID=1932789 RepID=UPI003F7DF446